MPKKKISHPVKDLDESKGIVVAYANVYGNEDSDGDISQPGSFRKTVKEQIKKIRVLKDHFPTISLGVPLELDAEDPYGLKTVTQFNMDKDVARDMFSDIKLYMEHDRDADLSIGYEVIKRNEKDRRKIEEYKLYEYSFLTGWGANPLAVAEGVKSMRPAKDIIDLITKAYDMDYSDERLKQIESLLKSLDGQEPSDDTLEKEPHKSTSEDEPIEVLDSFSALETKLKLSDEKLWTLKN